MIYSVIASSRELDTQCSSTALPILSISKYAESDDFCLFREFFKETNDTDCDYVESLVAEGKFLLHTLHF